MTLSKAKKLLVALGIGIPIMFGISHTVKQAETRPIVEKTSYNDEFQKKYSNLTNYLAKNEEERKLLNKWVQEKTSDIIDQHNSGKINMNSMVNTVKIYESYIKDRANHYGIPYEIAFGLPTIENGGGICKYSNSKPACAGVTQLSENVAVKYGLMKIEKKTKIIKTKKNKKIKVKQKVIVFDHRCDPYKNIDAGFNYLKDLYRMYGDWGFAVQAFHTGPGNLGKLFKKYARTHIPQKVRWLDVYKHQKLLNIIHKDPKNGGRFYVPKVIASNNIYKIPDEYIFNFSKKQ